MMPTRANIKKFLERLPAQVDRKPYEKIALYSPVGCEKCSGIGYKGRVGIFEFFQGGPDLETNNSKGSIGGRAARSGKKAGDGDDAGRRQF